MNCTTAEKYILLSKKEKLIGEIALKLNSHIKGCKNCFELVNEMHSYEEYISNLRKIEPEIEFPHMLTNQIMTEIEMQKGKKRIWSLNCRVVFNYPVLRHSLLIILLLPILIFAVQNHTINSQALALRAFHKQQSEEQSLYRAYNECIETSTNMIADALLEDKGVQEKLIHLSGQKFPSNLRMYSSKICQMSQEYYDENNSIKRKEILFGFIETELQIEL